MPAKKERESCGGGRLECHPTALPVSSGDTARYFQLEGCGYKTDSALAMAAMLACSADDLVGSSNEPLTGEAWLAYTNAPRGGGPEGPNHFGTTSTITVNDTGPTFKGEPDTLGRHNSMSVQGLSWMTFAGDQQSLGHESMDMVSISPR